MSVAVIQFAASPGQASRNRTRLLSFITNAAASSAPIILEAASEELRDPTLEVWTEAARKFDVIIVVRESNLRSLTCH